MKFNVGDPVFIEIYNTKAQWALGAVVDRDPNLEYCYGVQVPGYDCMAWRKASNMRTPEEHARLSLTL